jgi:hypothetical protein
MRPLFTILFSFTLLLNSCASTRINPLLSQEPDTEIPKKEFKALSKRAQKLWAARNDPSSLGEFILIQKKISRSKQCTQSDLTQLSRAEYIMGEFLIEDENERMAHFEEGVNWGEKALTFNPKFRKALVEERLPAELALENLEARDAESLYWMAVSLGKWASKKGVSTSLKYKDRIKKMIDRVSALKPDYFHGAVNRYYGAFYASLPGFNEEDLKLSRRFFEKAIKTAPGYFANHILFAEYYARKMDDQPLYRKHLEIVTKGNPQSMRDDVPEQTLEQTRARKLLEGINTK